MWWAPKSGADKRTFDDLIADIRAMNEYNARFLEGIVIFLAVALVGGGDLTRDIGLTLLLLGFGSGAVAMFFLPLPKPEGQQGGDESGRVRQEREMTYARKYWLLKIVLSQATVVFTLSGILTIMIDAMSS
jgi:hypothetical protein